MEKALDSKTKALETIKVVTLVFLKPYQSVYTKNIPDITELFNNNYFCFIKDLPANLSLEQYMQAVKAAVNQLLSTVPYHVIWDQFTIYVELTKDRGKKIFDFKHPYTVDESWDMTLNSVYEESQMEKAKQETEDDAAIEEGSSSLEYLDKVVETATEGVTDVQSMVEADAQRVEDAVDSKREEYSVKFVGSVAKFKKNEKQKFEGRKKTRKDFDEIVGKNLILRVYRY